MGRILIKACLLVPSAEAVTDRLPVTAVKAGADQVTEGNRRWLVTTLALAALRSGDLERVMELTEHADDAASGPSPHQSESLRLAIRCLALTAAGETEQARKELTATERLLLDKPETGYHNWLIVDILRREAESELAKQAEAE